MSQLIMLFPIYYSGRTYLGVCIISLNAEVIAGSSFQPINPNQKPSQLSIISVLLLFLRKADSYPIILKYLC